MIKPIWAFAGVALLGTAGVAGAFVVTSSGGEEEVAQQVETATSAASASPTTSTTEAPTATTFPAQPTSTGGSTTSTYTNPIYGYSLEYPNDWFVYTDPGGLTIITSYDPATAKGIGALPGDVLKIDVAVQENPDSLNLTDWIAEADSLAAQYGAVTVTSQSLVLVQGLPGLRREVVGGPENTSAVQYYFLLGSQVYTLVGQPSQSPLIAKLDEIVDSFQLRQ